LPAVDGIDLSKVLMMMSKGRGRSKAFPTSQRKQRPA
jgi:hypothetical protein